MSNGGCGRPSITHFCDWTASDRSRVVEGILAMLLGGRTDADG